MSEPRLNYVTCPDGQSSHRMAYWEWGAAQSNHVVVCVHGLTRQGRDFDVLAQALCAQAGQAIRVVCPDVAGRGQSDWLTDPMRYQVPHYAADTLALLAQLQAQTVDWVGTSMGGLIGMVLAGQPELSKLVPIRRMVLNDVGPAIQWQSLQRISQYLGRVMEFHSLQQAADALWEISKSFGPHTAQQWLELTRHMVKPVADGSPRVRLHYDPAIAQAFSAVTEESSAQGEAMLWQLYDQMTASTLLLRGAQSDLLSAQTALAMTQRGPKARLLEFAGVGHAPTLIAADQVQAVVAFLLGQNQG